MFLLKWYREYKEIKNKHCESCETLRQQLEIANYEKRLLLDRIMEKPAPVVETPPIPISLPKTIPWTVKKQMLEAEDREKAKLLRNAPKPVQTVEEIEKELGIVDEAKS